MAFVFIFYKSWKREKKQWISSSLKNFIFSVFTYSSAGRLNCYYFCNHESSTVLSAKKRRFWESAAPLMDQGIFTIVAFVKIPWSLCSQILPKSSYYLSQIRQCWILFIKISKQFISDAFTKDMKILCNSSICLSFLHIQFHVSVFDPAFFPHVLGDDEGDDCRQDDLD